jgi:TolB-like protein
VVVLLTLAVAYRVMTRRDATASTLAATRVAVLPFRSISPNADDKYFAEGMTDEMISALSGIGGLKVIARSSITPAMTSGQSPAAIAHTLGVGSLLDGSVRKDGNRVRISVSLLDPATGESRWSSNYDKTVTDVFGIQQDVAMSVARALKVALGNSVRPTGGTTNAGAYEDYLRATALTNNSIGLIAVESSNRAITLFRSAIVQDSSFALAWAALADTYVGRMFNTGAPTAVRDSAVIAVARAMALDTALAEAYRARSNLAYTRESGWDILNSLRDVLRAVSLKPGWAQAHATLASLYIHIGLFPEAQRELETGLSLDPTSWFVKYRIPRVLWQRQRFQEALAKYESDRRNGMRTSIYEEAMVLGYLGRPEEGLARLALSDSQIVNTGDVAATRAALLARLGRKEDALQSIAEAERRGAGSSHFHHATFAIATTYALLGDDHAAMAWLDRTARDGMPALGLFERDPTLTRVRTLPEYAALAARLRNDEAEYRRIISSIR